MTVYSEPIHAGEALVSEANGNRSREAVTIASGADLSACTVLGRVNLGAATAAASVPSRPPSGDTPDFSPRAGAGPRWLDVPGAQERLARLQEGATVADLYEGEPA